VKIIYSDNIPSDTSSETLFVDGIPEDHRATAQKVCDKLNSRLGDRQGPFYKIVADEHELYVWEP
jgi:hypothetical protein